MWHITLDAIKANVDSRCTSTCLFRGYLAKGMWQHPYVHAKTTQLANRQCRQGVVPTSTNSRGTKVISAIPDPRLCIQKQGRG